MLQSRGEVAKKKIATEKAFGEAVKDNMADRVIENFVGELSNLDFDSRFVFCLALLRGNDEDPAQVVENLAEKSPAACLMRSARAASCRSFRSLLVSVASWIFYLAQTTK